MPNAPLSFKYNTLVPNCRNPTNIHQMFSQEHRNDWVFQVCLSHYTIQGACVAIDNVDDLSEITATREAMKLLGFHDDELGGHVSSPVSHDMQQLALLYQHRYILLTNVKSGAAY